MERIIEPKYDITKIDNNEIRIKDIIKKGIKDCDVAIIGIPFDGMTFGRTGARYAPKYIREYMYNLNTYSYTLDFDLSVLNIFDFGDIEVSNSNPDFSFKNIYNASLEIFKRAKLSVFLGGDHSITYPIFLSLTNYLDRSLALVVFDAHHDVREVKENYATSGFVIRKIINEAKHKPKIFQIGMRDFYNSKKYIDYVKSNGIEIYNVEEIREKGLKEISKEIKEKISDFPLYISIDLDVVDSCFIEGVNSLVINGLYPYELIFLAKELSKNKNLKGIDFVEVAPIYEHNNNTAGLASIIILSCISSFFKNINVL